jgi:GT2 family glycosyltransferase
LDVSVVIINFNTKELTAQAVKSVQDTVKKASCEIIVVDNSSDPAECYQASLPGVTVLTGVENCGFGHACNLGASHAQGDFLLFLNSDTVVNPEAIDRTVDYIKAHPEVGVVGIRPCWKTGPLTTVVRGDSDSGCFTLLFSWHG